MKDQNLNQVNEAETGTSTKSSDTAVRTFFTKRNIGLLALAYAASILAQNVLFGVSGAPGYNDPIEVVLSYHANNQSTLAITSGLEAVNMVFLLFFVTALGGYIKNNGNQGSNWVHLSTIASATLSALFALTIATHISVTLAAKSLIEPNYAFQMMWQFHAASFALSLPALGLTIIGTVLAIHSSGLIRSTMKVFGLLISILPIIAGLGNLAVAGGSSFIYIGVMGLFLWILWLILTGLKLIRG